MGGAESSDVGRSLANRACKDATCSCTRNTTNHGPAHARRTSPTSTSRSHAANRDVNEASKSIRRGTKSPRCPRDSPCSPSSMVRKRRRLEDPIDELATAIHEFLATNTGTLPHSEATCKVELRSQKPNQKPLIEQMRQSKLVGACLGTRTWDILFTNGP